MNKLTEKDMKNKLDALIQAEIDKVKVEAENSDGFLTVSMSKRIIDHKHPGGHRIAVFGKDWGKALLEMEDGRFSIEPALHENHCVMIVPDEGDCKILHKTVNKKTDETGIVWVATGTTGTID